MPKKPRRRSESVFSSTSVKLSLQYGALYGALTAIVLFFAYEVARDEVEEWVSDDLQNRLVEVRTLYEEEGLNALRETISTLSKFHGESHNLYLLTDQSGQALAGNIAGVPLVPPVSRDTALVTRDQIKGLTVYDPEMQAYWFHAVEMDGYVVYIGTSNHLSFEVIEAIGLALAIGGLFLLVSGLIAGVLVGKRTELRLRRISSALDRVSDGAIQTRVKVSETDKSDMGKISRNINATLMQVEALIEMQKQISTDIAHDLRTPVQHLRQSLEGLQSGLDKKQITAEDLENIIAQVDEINAVFSALLRISQLESDQRKTHFRPCDLRTLVEDVVDVYQAVAEEEQKTITNACVGSGFVVSGDKHLLTQLLANLLENAITHCPAGTIIDVSLVATETGIRLCVQDNGPGIPAEQYGKVLRRFYRLERSRTSSGNGLGLSLVAVITKLHGASLKLGDADPGLRVCVQFPEESMATDD